MSSLNIASRALVTNQSVLQVIGHNIANVNTPGYSRQSAQVQQVPGQFTGSGYFGKGVELSRVDRAYDQFLTQQANSLITRAGSDATRYDGLLQVETLFPLGEGGLGDVLTKALNVWVDAAAAPTDGAARTVVLNRMDELAKRFNDTQVQLGEIRLNAFTQVEATVDKVNLLAGQIAGLNEQIARSQTSGLQPNDLLDQRDKLIADLTREVQITALPQDDGTITLFVAGSLPLVLGNKAGALSVERDTVDNSRVALGLRPAGTAASATPVPIGNDALTVDDALGGGSLQGLARLINEDLPETVNSVGRLALAMVEQMNRQHRGGLDLSGNPGGDLFTAIALPAGQAYPTNSGTAALSMAVADATAMVASDYEVTYATATTVQVRRLSDGLYADGTGGWVSTAPAALALPQTFDGLSLSQPSGTATAGDRFLLRPFQNAAAQMEKALTLPGNLALASPVYAAANIANPGSVTIEQVSTAVSASGSAAATLPNNLPELELEFLAGGNVGFSFNGTAGISIASVSRPGEPAITAAPFELPFESGKTLQVRLAFGASPNQTFVDYQIKLRGLPTVGDTIDLRPQWRGQASPTNIGTASIASLSKTSASTTTPFEISYASGTAYTVPAGATQTGTIPSVTITFNGVSVLMEGTPSPGDRFLFQPAPLTQNSDNAKALLGLRDVATFDNGTTLGDGYIPVLAGVSSLLQEGKFNAEFSTQQAEGAETRRANAVGVNLDEEAARMLQYQQAYQASARYLQTAQSLFDTLLASFAR